MVVLLATSDESELSWLAQAIAQAEGFQLGLAWLGLARLGLAWLGSAHGFFPSA